MSLEQELFSALSPLVTSRVYPNTFLQPDGTLPPWPSIRYAIVSNVPEEDLCGDGDDTTSSVRVQLDVVASTYASMRTLRLAVMSAMRVLPTPARLQLDFDEYEAETKTHRSVMTYLIGGSST